MATDPRVSIALPVGPFPGNTEWLGECLDSIKAQTHQPDEVFIVSDMGGLSEGMDHRNPYPIRTWSAPWRLGVPSAFNFAVALADHDLVFLMGSDDTLEPECIELCLAEYEKNNRQDAYYFVGVHYMEGEDQNTPCGYALVTKGLWRATGGFPIESAVGAPDAAYISILIKHRPELLVPVADGRPLVNYRRHMGSDTGGRGPWQGAILETRRVLTDTWTPPEWAQC